VVMIRPFLGPHKDLIRVFMPAVCQPWSDRECPTHMNIFDMLFV
jgi:hypothetical protein